ncbi:MAG: hypothetical protein Q9187_009066, partial [Circinaria calcarea]
MKASIASLSPPTSTMLRLCARQRLSSLQSTCITAQQRGKADIVQRAGGEFDRTPSFASPFVNDERPTTRIPSFGSYMSRKGGTPNKTFQYFMVGTMGALAAAGAKATVQ